MNIDIDFFNEHGWWISPEVFDADTIARARQHAQQVHEGAYASGRSPQVVYVPDARQNVGKYDNAW